MARTGDKTHTIDGLQGLVALIGITVGVIPLIRWTLQGEHGAIFGWIFGDPSGSMGYVTPLAVVAGAILMIVALEIFKKRP